MKPICLPFEDSVRENYTLNEDEEPLDVWVAGWGSTDPKSKYQTKNKT